MTDEFETTHWSVVFQAGNLESPGSLDAMEQLCRVYWVPVYAYVRRKVRDEHEAQDITQGFFARLLENNFVESADPRKGRFRAFLLTAVKHYMSNDWDMKNTVKRGGGTSHLSLDFKAIDGIGIQLPDLETPETLFVKQWATALLEQVLDRLRSEFVSKGEEVKFDELKPLIIPNRSDANYKKVAAQQGTTEAVLRVTIHRLRKRYQQLLRTEILRTVSDPSDVEDEIRDLFAAF